MLAGRHRHGIGVLIVVLYSVEDVKELRKRTGCFLTDCKKALVEFNGDFEKALEWLRVNGREATCRCGYPMSRAHEMHRHEH